MKIKSLALSAVLAAGTVCGVRAQNADSTSVELPDATVVSSVKGSGKVGEIPSSTVVVTSFDAKKAASTTVADVLRNEPGLSKGGDGVWATNINIRGIGENRLVTLIDRNRVETATELTTSLSMLDVNDIERIEVIKGAQSSIYGSGAVGGIINVVMKDGHFSGTPYFRGNATANFSSVNNGYSEYLSLYGGGKKWYVKVKGSFAGGSDVKTPAGYLKNSGYKSADAGLTAAFKPVENQVLKLQFQRNFSWDVGIPGGAAFTPLATASYNNAGRTLASLEYKISEISEQLAKLDFKAFYQGISLDVEMLPNIPAPQTGASPEKVNPFAVHRTFGFSAESNLKLAGWNSLVLGADIWQRRISGDRKKYISQYSEGIVVARMIRDEMPLPNASHTSAGIYAQDEMRFLDERMILSFGARADLNYIENSECHNVEYVKDAQSGAVNPNPPGKYVTFRKGERLEPSWSANAGLLYKASGRCDLTLNISRSYRSPAMEELFKFIDLAGNKIHFGNPSLKAEKGLGGDIGVRYHGEKLDFRVSGYVNGIRDMIVERKVNTDPTAAIDTLALANASRALLYGFDFNISYEPLKGLKIYASGAWTIGRDMSGTQDWLPMIPPLSGRAGISYENRKYLGASLEVAAAGARKAGCIAPGERPTEAWYRLDFAIHSKVFSFGRCALQFFGGIDNITDNKYTNFLSTNRGNIICEPGRNFYVRANFSF